MRGLFIHAAIRPPLLAALLLLAGGCGGSGGADMREDRHPLMRRAQALKQRGDPRAAADAYQRALESRPSLVRAHLELGQLYCREPLNDHLRAAWHFRRYLELRPDSENAAEVRQLLQMTELSHAASLASRPEGAIDMIARLKTEVAALKDEVAQVRRDSAALQKENEGLRREVERLGGTLPAPPATLSEPPPRAAVPEAPPAAPPPRTPVAPPPVAVPVPAIPAPLTLQTNLVSGGAAPAPRTYTVQSGDTLSSIATKVYHDSASWENIYEANRSQLSSPGAVKPGQVLVIPPKANR